MYIIVHLIKADKDDHKKKETVLCSDRFGKEYLPSHTHRTRRPKKGKSIRKELLFL